MSKVSPTSTNDNVLSNLLDQESSFANMSSNGPMTTSFSNEEYISNEQFDSTERIKNFPSNPNQTDSIYIHHDQRSESIDIEEQSLHQIARDGDVSLMKAVLKRLHLPTAIKKKINQKDSDKFTPLHYAARYNNFKMCVLLVKLGAYLHSRGEDQLTPLHLVAKYKPKKEKVFGAGDGNKSDISSEEDAKEQQEANIKILDYLVEKGARVNERDFYGLTPLHHACLRGNEKCVKRLLQKLGILIEAQDRQQMTPLHLCAIYGHANIAKILIEHQANVNCRDDDGGTPVQFAAAEGNLEIVELIFNQCNMLSDIRNLLDQKDSDENFPLHLAVDSGHLHVTSYIVQQCLEINYNAGLNAKGNSRETPLHISAKHGHLDIVKFLIKNGAKINPRNENMQTPLFLAAQYNHYKVVEFLIECGANINLHDIDKYTALLIAASYGHSETIQVLLESKADVLAVDKNDKTIVFICAEEDRVDALKKLDELQPRKIRSLLEVTDKYDNTPLHVAADNGNIEIVKLLLELGSVVDAKNEDEQTPLHLAANNGSFKIIKALVSKKREIVHHDDENGNTPLHLAALSGRENCIRELVRLGANIAARNSKQWTPLDCCASVGMHKSARILLEFDAPVDAKDRRKQTPLHLACVRGHRKMVELLLDWGADVSHRSVKGKNALDFAIEFGNTDCAAAIIESDQWIEALQNRTYDYNTDQPTDTPMRKLIRRMPSVATQVFRKCLSDNEKHKDDRRYEITFNYEFLDDEFSCTNWVEDTVDSMSQIQFDGVETSSQMLLANNEHIEVRVADDSIDHHHHEQPVYDDNGRVVKTASPYSKDSNILKDNHPLYVMVKAKRVELLRHPLVISLLNHKWRAYGRTFYYTNLFIYSLFLAIISSFALTTPPPYAVDFNITTSSSPCATFLPAAQSVWGTECRFRPPWQSVSMIFVLALASFGLVKEFYQLFSQRIEYLKNVENFIEVGAYILSILLVIDVTELGRNTGIREAWQWQCGAAAIFLSWLGLLLFIQNFPTLGIFVLMFNDVIRTFISFSVVFLLFIVGFAFSFHILLQNQFAFNFWWNSIVKTFVMMIGEFDYDAIFNAEATDSESYTSQLHFEAITYIIFVVFIIIMSIIIMNLLVGLAVDDIKEVQNNAKLESLAMQVKLALDIEYTLPKWFRRRYMKKYRKYAPNKYRHANVVLGWFYNEYHLNHDTIDEALNPEKSDLQLVEDKVDGLQVKVRELREMICGLNDRSRQVETVSQAIANHFKISWENADDDQD